MIAYTDISALYDDVLSAADVGEMIGKTAVHVTRLCVAGDIEAKKIGRFWIIHRAAVAEYQKKPTNGRGNPNWKKS